MTTKTVTDYETQEVEREVTHCNFPGCVQSSEEAIITEVAKNARGEQTHLCESHFTEIFGGDSVRVIQDGVQIVEEKNPVITMPWDKWSLGGFYTGYGNAGLGFYLAFSFFLLPLSAICAGKNNERFNQGYAMAGRVMLIYGLVIMAAVWFLT